MNCIRLSSNLNDALAVTKDQNLNDALAELMEKEFAVIRLRFAPTEERPSAYEIQPFDQALHQAPKRRLRPEVALTIKIMQRHRGYVKMVVDHGGSRVRPLLSALTRCVLEATLSSALLQPRVIATRVSFVRVQETPP
jgi:hypothetical protein